MFGYILGPVDISTIVNFWVVPVTAQLNKDYKAVNGTVTFSAGTTQSKITVSILSDKIPEIEERFKIVLNPPTGDTVLVDPSQIDIIINANDDQHGILSLKTENGSMFPYPTVTANEDTSSEIVDLIVVRSGGTFGRVSVRWKLERNDSSQEEIWSDISPSEDTVWFMEGEKERTVRLFLTQDTDPEPMEKYSVTLLAESVTGLFF